MMTEKGVVIAYQEGIATVKCQSQSACGSCSAKTACGTTALSELTGEPGEHIFTVMTITPLNSRTTGRNRIIRTFFYCYRHYCFMSCPY